MKTTLINFAKSEFGSTVIAITFLASLAVAIYISLSGATYSWG